MCGAAAPGAATPVSADMADGNSGSAPAQRGPQRLAPMALNLLTGTAMSLAAQAVTDMVRFESFHTILRLGSVTACET